jgi:para-nitrobenzyl esterase
MNNYLGPQGPTILAQYPHATDADAQSASRDLSTDLGFAWHVWTWARLQAQKGKGEAFVYYFDVRAPGSQYGASHGADVPYVFVNFGVFGDQGAMIQAASTQDSAVSDLMRRYWVNFAATGDPNGLGLPAWPAFAATRPQAMVFDNGPSARALPNLARLQVLDAYFTKLHERAEAP